MTEGVITRFAFPLDVKHFFGCAYFPPITVNLKDASKRLLLAEDRFDFSLFSLSFFLFKDFDRDCRN